MLAALVSGARPDAGREVDEPDPGFGGVLVLATLSSRAEGLDAALGEEVLVPVRDVDHIVGILRHAHCIY